MAESVELKGNEFWLDKGGKVVEIHGYKHELKVDPYLALRVAARPVSRAGRYYLYNAARAGTGWFVDILGDEKVYGHVVEQLTKGEV